MLKIKKSVLFISHEASFTGAPTSLLNFIRWFKGNVDIPFYILLGKGGPLISEFKSLGQVYFYNYYDFSPTFIPISKSKYLNYLFRISYLTILREFIKEKNVGLIYSNTITNGKILNELSNLHCPVITHVREMEYIINSHGKINFDFVKSNTSRYIAVSGAVKNNLINKYNIPSENIEVIYNSINLNLVNDNFIDINENKHIITEELNIPKDSFLVGASGSIHWLKGPDLFIQLAREVLTRKLDIPVHFIWIGSETSEHLLPKLSHDLVRLGIENKIHFIGHRQNPFEYYAAFDVFALVSREDSFPLVCLEAASLKTPILCFENAGGAIEFVENDCGFVIPYLDIPTMADRLIELIESPKLLHEMSDRALKKAKENHDLTTCSTKILDEIKKYL